MGEQTQNLQAVVADPDETIVDPEKTLVAPRFDAREASTAQPVVPLSESPASRVRRPGTLPLALILVSALVGGLVSVFAYRLYQQRVQSSAHEQQQQMIGESPTPQQQPEATPELSSEVQVAVPVESAEPTPAPEVAEVREEEEPAPEPAAREEAREDRADRDSGAARERDTAAGRTPARNVPASERTSSPRARRVEEITTPTRDLKIGRERYDGQEASDYEVPQRARRRDARRNQRRNMDRVRAIFEGEPPAQ